MNSPDRLYPSTNCQPTVCKRILLIGGHCRQPISTCCRPWRTLSPQQPEATCKWPLRGEHSQHALGGGGRVANPQGPVEICKTHWRPDSWCLSSPAYIITLGCSYSGQLLTSVRYRLLVIKLESVVLCMIRRILIKLAASV